MKDDTMTAIGQSLFNFQAALKQSGSSLEDYLEKLDIYIGVYRACMES